MADSRSALKNADSFLEDVLKAVDTSGDGKIQYEGMSWSFRPLLTSRA
jgi:hypothetical protein